MSLFTSPLHQDIWIEAHCERCHYGSFDTLCPILRRALRSGRKPVEWERNTRKGVLMADTMKCNMETRQPPALSRRVVDVDVPMFEVETPGVAMDSEHQ